MESRLKLAQRPSFMTAGSTPAADDAAAAAAPAAPGGAEWGAPRDSWLGVGEPLPKARLPAQEPSQAVTPAAPAARAAGGPGLIYWLIFLAPLVALAVGFWSIEPPGVCLATHALDLSVGRDREGLFWNQRLLRPSVAAPPAPPPPAPPLVRLLQGVGKIFKR